MPSVAPAPFVPGGSSANPAAFGAPSGGLDVRSHIPKKGKIVCSYFVLSLTDLLILRIKFLNKTFIPKSVLLYAEIRIIT